MRSNRHCGFRAACALAFVLIATGAYAQESLADDPGYFPIDELGIFDPDGSSVDIDLQGAMLRLVGAAVLQEEPSLAELVSQMRALRVLVAPAAELDAEKTIAAIHRGAAALEERGWHRVVRVRDEGEQVYVYLREIDERIEGLTVLVFDAEDELTLINIVGRIDVDLLGAVSRAFDVPALEEALEQSPPAPPPPGGKP